MSLSSFFLGTGIALITALIGWSNQIKETQTETKRLEKLFTTKLNLKYPDFKKTVSSQSLESIEDEIFSCLTLYKKIISKNVKQSGNNLKILNKFPIVEEKFSNLKKKYNLKYLTSLWLGITSLIVGTSMYIIEEFYTENLLLSNKIYFIIATIPIILLIILIYSLFSIHSSEKKFQEYISKEFIDIED